MDRINIPTAIEEMKAAVIQRHKEREEIYDRITDEEQRCIVNDIPYTICGIAHAINPGACSNCGTSEFVFGPELSSLEAKICRILCNENNLDHNPRCLRKGEYDNFRAYYLGIDLENI